MVRKTTTSVLKVGGLLLVGFGAFSMGSSSAHAGLMFTNASGADFESDNGLYGKISTGIVFFEAPRRDHIGATYEECCDDDSVARNNVYKFEPDDEAPAIAFTLGRQMADYSLFGGENTRIEGTLQYFRADDSQTTTRKTDATFTDFLGIDGSGYVDDVGMDTTTGSFSADYNVIDVDVRIRSDIQNSNKKLTWTPSVGIALTRVEEDHDVSFTAYGEGSRLTINTIDESVDTVYVGPVAGIQFNYQTSPKWSFNGGVDLHMAYVDVDYKGSQLPGDPEIASMSSSDDDSDFSLNTTISLGTTYDTGGSKLSFVAGWQYWSYAPVIEHPVATIGNEYNDTTPTRPSHIGSDSMTMGFIGLSLTKNF